MSSDGNEIGTDSRLAKPSSRLAKPSSRLALRSSSLPPEPPQKIDNELRSSPLPSKPSQKIDKSLAIKSTKEMTQPAARNQVRSFSGKLPKSHDKFVSDTDDNDEEEKEISLTINEWEPYTPTQSVARKKVPSFSRRGKRSEKPTKKQEARKRQKARQIFREALHNTSNTITLVATLIATFTYNAGFNPPGGLHQGGPLIGTPVAAKKTAFRVFSVCNNLALFISLCVVLVLVSIIPFKRKALMRMLAVAHKVVWVAVSFMATSYVAAAMVIMKPEAPRKAMEWTTIFLSCLCVGSLGSAIIGLGIMLVKHRLRKREWRKRRARGVVLKGDEEYESSSSTNSDIYCSHAKGYYSF